MKIKKKEKQIMEKVQMTKWEKKKKWQIGKQLWNIINSNENMIEYIKKRDE